MTLSVGAVGIGLGVVVGLLAFLGLAILGTMREIVVLRSEVAALKQLVTVPPTPDWSNGGIPPAMLVRLLDDLAVADDCRVVLLFVDSACPTCRTLVSQLAQQTNLDPVRRHVVFVVMDKVSSPIPSTGITDQIDRAQCRSVVDTDNDLMQAAGVHGTPTGVAYDRTQVFGYRAGAEFRWVLDQLNSLNHIEVSR